ncbi:hypothetical protein ABB37_01443 [Leptomonas pyrrhocoris]|uniref:Uncharacterized protein n=1 Tax=Leptomonas pyrrhocoris TaxID=157538 RepID=A0A0M9G905_LEPPY|nr:hypothetical protein ABB37_01443 [Leptomonas pyrrhocoris]KPA85016.1 hypothetical protein ABB37_01443 [Leptomonas pyrrhocoris]|eukprot:XP_015663455.1 hypothetical protein ABB37_01443 [Leptomonas pyrrhocoris]
MRRNHLLLVRELARTLYSVAPAPTLSMGNKRPPAADALTARSASKAAATNRQKGTITEWDPFERHGVIQDAAGHCYRIANTRAFETVLPTMLRTLEGAVVEFDVGREAAADRVIIRNRLTPITAESYRQEPPVNFLSAEMLGQFQPASRFKKGTASATKLRNEAAALTTQRTSSSKHAAAEKTAELYARNITVDIGSIPAKQIARWSGPLSDEAVIMPTKNLKDMRSSRLFDGETNAYLKLAQQLGSGEAAQRLLAAQQERAEAEAVQRVVVAAKATGVVLAWSGIHRSGLIREDSATDAGKAASANATTTTAATAMVEGIGGNAEPVCIIRNVYAFQSALPTSQSLLQRRVTFTKVTYSTQPHRAFAENIAVEGDVRYDNAVLSLEDVHAAKQKERAAALRSGRPGALILEDEPDDGGGDGTGVARAAHSGDASGVANHSVKTGEATAAASPIDGPREKQDEPVDPNKVYYGVVVRWSGGQGVVEGGDGHHYFLRSAADFVQLVDQNSHQLRGAVVQFQRDAANPRYARAVDILSTAATTLREVRPMLEKTQFVVRGTSAPCTAEHQAAARPSQPSEANAADVEPEGVAWIYGTVLSWSAVEGQGIVLSDADQEARYVLRDPEENVIAYASTQHRLRKGRQVKFTTFGSTGRLVCNLVLLDSEVEEEVLREDELRPREPVMTLDGNMNEAIPSPMSTSYWLNRMDKAGFDTKEVKDLQNRALTLDEDDDDDGTEGGKFLDSEELLKKDPWWSDPRKNVRFPNSDMTAGHLALIGPASMMNVAMKTKDPKKLDKMLKKYQSRLTEDQKEHAWKQAKEMAPKYEECIRKSRERNEEPKFYFF